MPNEALLVSTVVMGMFLVGAALSTTWMRKRPGYAPQFHPASHDGLIEGGKSGFVQSNAGILALVALLVVFGGGVLFGDGTLGLVVVTPVLIAAYLTWGVYHIARVRGLPRAHSVGLSAWVFGVVLVGTVAVKLLLG